MKTLSFRAPGRRLALGALLARALPSATRRGLDALVRGGDVRVARTQVSSPAMKVPPGALVEANVRGSTAHGAPTEIAIHQRGAGFVVVDKPAGLPCHEATAGTRTALDLVADALGLGRDALWPVHRLDADVSGVWLVATNRETAAKLSGAFANREVLKEYRALVPALPWTDGTFDGRLDGKKARTDYREVERRGDLSDVSLTLHTGRQHQLRRHLAGAGSPIVGDSLYGGVMVTGGLRLRATHLVVEAANIDVRLSIDANWWPTESAFPGGSGDLVLTVSEATWRATSRGHPWILTDTETSDTGAFLPGTIVSVRDKRGRSCGSARIEGTGRIAARVAAAAPDLVPAALARRARLSTPSDAVRLIHGEADGLPGLVVERHGDALRVLVSGASALGLVEPTADSLTAALADQGVSIDTVVVVNHLAGAPSGQHRRVRLLRGHGESPRVVTEGGLRFVVDLGLGEPFRSTPGTGLFLDQRANRKRLRQRVNGGRWLNLFCHTGSFSAVAMAAGAEQVTSVDLSAHYLRWLDENLALNGLDDKRHISVKRDVRRFLDRLDPGESFDGIILDPPTAAAAGRKFWSVRRDGAKLIQTVLERLEPGGTLLVCRNDRRARGRLEELVRTVAHDARVPLADVQEARADVDFPTLPGFPEGDPFEGLWIERGARRPRRRP